MLFEIYDLGQRDPVGILDRGATALVRSSPDKASGDLVEIDIASGRERPWRGARAITFPRSGTGSLGFHALSQDGRYYETEPLLDGFPPIPSSIDIIDLETATTVRIDRRQVAPQADYFSILAYEYGIALIKTSFAPQGKRALLVDTLTMRSYDTPTIPETDGGDLYGALSRDGLFFGLGGPGSPFSPPSGEAIPRAVRLADLTRPLPAGQTLEVKVTGRAGVPANAKAVVLNMTAVDATADGFATVYPCGQPRPNASNLNFSAGQTTPNLVIAKPGIDGKICIYTYSTIHVLADVAGYFPASSDFTPTPNPARILDTRNNIGI